MLNSTIKYLKENYGRLIKIRYLKNSNYEKSETIIGVIAKQSLFWSNKTYSNFILLYCPYYLNKNEFSKTMIIDCKNDLLYFEKPTKSDLNFWLKIYNDNKNERDTEDLQKEYGIDIKNIKY